LFPSAVQFFFVNSLFLDMFSNSSILHFQKALAAYIKRYAYSNAKTDDLWAVLEEKSGEPVKSLMTTWTKQQGYPVINAKLKGNRLELEQVSTNTLFFLCTFCIHIINYCLEYVKYILVRINQILACQFIAYTSVPLFFFCFSKFLTCFFRRHSFC